ncbi:hypothetical protein [Epibacterium ulvae]|uniref:hypothetical protein n=1 Tax=Epibacterium ulvae TaxID=1156985 RepID=UPI00248F53F2|nr:hypothetical protein [Epibacterium ulvae]
MAGSKFVLNLCLLPALCFATPALSDQSCFKQNFVKIWAKKFSTSDAFAKETIYSTEMPATLDAIYDRYIERALKVGDARSAFETFEVEWNIESYDSQIPDYELVPRALRSCVKWMWNQ